MNAETGAGGEDANNLQPIDPNYPELTGLSEDDIVALATFRYIDPYAEIFLKFEMGLLPVEGLPKGYSYNYETRQIVFGAAKRRFWQLRQRN